MDNDNPFAARLSLRIQDLRSARNMTLEALAERSGLSRATLSRIERGETSPTAAQLGRLCAVFELTMSQLLMPLEARAPELVPADRQSVWVDPETGFRRRVVSPPSPDLALELMRGELPAGQTIDYPVPPVTALEHHLWMLSGTLEFTHAGIRHHLAAGDCLRLQISGPNHFRAPGPYSAVYLIAIARRTK